MPSYSAEEVFLIFSYVFVLFKSRDPLRRAILDPEATILSNLVKGDEAMLHTKF